MIARGGGEGGEAGDFDFLEVGAILDDEEGRQAGLFGKTCSLFGPENDQCRGPGIGPHAGGIQNAY